MLVSFAALALSVAQPADTAPARATGTSTAPTSTEQVEPSGLRRQLAEEGTDFAVPLDWAGPAARRPGADERVREFDPAESLFGDNTGLCVVQRGQPVPDCARIDATPQSREVSLSDDVFVGGIENPDATCQTVETVRRGANGQPERVFATVCGDEAESWEYRQRRTPASRGSATRPSGRAVGPNDVTAPRVPEGAQPRAN